MRPLIPAITLCLCACELDSVIIFAPTTTDKYELPDNRIPTSQIEELSITTSDGVVLAALMVTQTTPADAPSVAYMHGQGGNLDHFWSFMMDLWDLGFNVLAIDYRGFGRSKGSPTEQGVYLDAQAALDTLEARDDIDTDRIIIWGFSLGTGIASHLAWIRPKNLLVLEAPYTSMAEMVERSAPLTIPSEWVTAAKLNTLGRIGEVESPVVVVHGTDDERIPISMGRRVFRAAREPKRFVGVKGGQHSESLALAPHDIVAAVRLVAPIVAP